LIRQARERFSVWATLHDAELLLSLRVIVAGLLTFALGHLLQLPEVYWGVLTVVLVMQPSVGGALKATVERIIGTLGGAVWAIVVSVSFPHSNVLLAGVALTVALAPLAVVAALWPEYRVAPVTAVIILLGSFEQREGTPTFALHRVLEIGLGCVVAFGVAFVMPAPAHGFLIKAAKRVLDLLATQTSVLFAGLIEPVDSANARALHDLVQGAMARVESSAREVVRERANHLTDAPDPDSLVRVLRRLRNDLAMIGRATVEPLPAQLYGDVADHLARASETIARYLRASADALAASAPPPSFDPVELAIRQCNANIETMRERLSRECSGETISRIFGLVFALNQLHRNLEDLDKRVHESP
jgi:uncharacterized membrane protein YccC